MLDEFDGGHLAVNGTRIFVRSGGAGAPLLLLHGFPETHLMWRSVAPALSDRFKVVCADLRGFGQSDCPPSQRGHASYSKRTMASDMVALMERLGHRTFFVAGHDRGGRAAYRLALDQPERVEGLAVLDIIPTAVAWDEADTEFALGYWPWSLLAHASPLPEKILSTAAEEIVDAALGGWGSQAATFPPDVRQAYIAALRDPGHARAICEEYRAAASIDREHDQNDIANGRKIKCEVLALWGAGGPVDTWYEGLGGPIKIWRRFADDVEGQSVRGGHFFPEQNPVETGHVLAKFFTRLRH